MSIDNLGNAPDESVLPDDATLVRALQVGDEEAFMLLVDTYHQTMVRIAMIYVDSQAIAEEVAQETWLAVLQGIDRFEGRSMLKTWIFRILKNRAITRAQREGRYILLDDEGDDEPSVDPARFRPADHPQWAHHWEDEPADWGTIPEVQLLSKETRSHIQTAIDALATQQREVITLRDVNGWSSNEVCELLGISEANQRVLLHRARSKVRQALEKYFADATN